MNQAAKFGGQTLRRSFSTGHLQLIRDAEVVSVPADRTKKFIKGLKMGLVLISLTSLSWSASHSQSLYCNKGSDKEAKHP